MLRMSINHQVLVAALGEHARVLSVQLFDQIDSTNQWLFDHPPTSPTLVVAERQTAGRGRRGRQWQSPMNGFYFSIGMPHEKGGFLPPTLSLAVAVALAERITALNVVNIQVKWPNDIVVNGAKIAGILVEKAQKTLVAGVGVNWHAEDVGALPEDRRAMGLAELLPATTPVAREAMLASFAVAVWEAMNMNAVEVSGWLGERWPRWDALAGHSIEVEHADGGVIRGRASGITQDGALRLLTSAGERLLHGGETRIRGGWE